MTIAILGAGIAGLACARVLAEAGRAVVLFDKGRAAGGRCATRRSDAGACDHGAQYWTARDPGFAAAVAAWADQGLAAAWGTTPAGEQRWIAVPGMSALPRHLAAGLALRTGQAITGLEGAPGAWLLRDDTGAVSGPYTQVLLTLPASQARALLTGPAPAVAEQLAPIVHAPCWALLAAGSDLDRGPEEHVDPAGPVLWACRLDRRPGRAPGPRWILHADAGWTRAHLEDSAEAVAAALLQELARIVGGPVAPSWCQAHRWRYARVETALGRPCVHDAALGLGYAGDGCLGPRIEAAWLSGRALAQTLLAG